MESEYRYGERVPVDSLSEMVLDLNKKFKQLGPTSSREEISIIRSCAEKILKEGFSRVSREEAKEMKEKFAETWQSALGLYQQTTEMLEFSENCHKLQEKCRAIKGQLLQARPRDIPTIELLTKTLDDLEKILIELMSNDFAKSLEKCSEELTQAGDDIGEGREKIASLKQEALLESFHLGIEKEVTACLKEARLALEERSTLVERQLFEGPKPKSKETWCCEEIVDALLNNPERVTVTESVERKTVFDGNEPHEEDVLEYYVTLQRQKIDSATGNQTTTEEKYNLRDLISSADFSQIYLDPNRTGSFYDMNHTFETYDDDVLLKKIARAKSEQTITDDENEALLNLSKAERLAVHMYTISGSDVMVNFLLRNLPATMFKKLEPFGVEAQTPNARCALVSESLIHAAVLHSALSKIPNFDRGGAHLFRVEGDLPDVVYQKREGLVQMNGIGHEPGIFSTSYGGPADNFWSAGPDALIYLENASGKNIGALSLTPDELEVAIPSAQIQWLSMQKVRSNIWKKDVVVFWGKIVRQFQDDSKSSAQYISFERYSSPLDDAQQQQSLISTDEKPQPKEKQPSP
jgi:hypothetical protein